jgi:hypothetical protein
VSLTAVPAQVPNPWSDSPIAWPSSGKTMTATMLKKNTTDTA